MPLLTSPLTAAEAVRFRYAAVDGPPYCWPFVKIVDRSTGDTIKGVLRANADEGWYEAYQFDEAGRPIINGDEYAKRIVETNVEISLDPDLLSDTFEYTNCADDIEAGAIYEENLTNEEREWIAKGKPYCHDCGRAPMLEHGATCRQVYGFRCTRLQDRRDS